MLLKAPSSLALNNPGDGAFPTSLGSLFRCLTTLIPRSFFLTSSLNLPSFSLYLPPVQIPLDGIPSTRASNAPLSSVPSTNLLGLYLMALSLTLMKILNN